MTTILGMRRRVTQVLGKPVAYIDEGAGPVILLLHAAPLTSLGFVRVIRALQDRYRLVAPDFPGFGASAPHDAPQPSLADDARFVTAFCDALGLEDVLVYVNDSSGCIGLAGLSPIAGRVRGLIVASTVPIPMTGRVALVRFVLTHVVTSRPVRVLNRRLNLLPWLVATVAPFLRPFGRTERKTLIAQFDTPARRDRILDVFSAMGRDQQFLEETAARAARAFRSTPVLLLYGQFDPMRLIGGVGRFREMFPQHTVSIVPFEEHFPILASGHRVAEAIDRWASTAGPSRAIRSGQVVA